MEYHTTAGAASASFAGKTLILPVVSHGNVGQLASDLMVNTIASLSRLGCLDHPALLPCVGCGTFSGSISGSSGGGGGGGGGGASGGDTAGSVAAAGHALALGMEVYGGDASDGMANVVIAQQRAEVVVGAQREFAAATAAWIAAAGFKEVVIMASMPSTAGIAPGQIGGTRFRHITTTAGSSDSRCEEAGITTLESEITPSSAFGDEDGGAGVLLPPWSLLRACKEAGVKATCVVAICSEGDNSADAAAMADAVSQTLGVMQSGGGAAGGASAGRWAVPPSWAAAYGAQPMNRAIFV
jgi:proteasome assembly chaperone 2